MAAITRIALRVALGIAGRPWLWVTAVGELLVLAKPGWWRGWPPLPMPAPPYLRFRLHTAYGDTAEGMDANDIIAYLSWCRRMRKLS